MSQEKVGGFPEELRRIAARADDIGGPHADQLWVRGVRRRRVQLIGYAGAVLLVISGSLAGFQTLRAAHSRVDVAAPAAAEIHLPTRISDTVGAIDSLGDRAPGPISVAFWARERHWSGESNVLVGVSGVDGKYVKLATDADTIQDDLPTVSANGEWVAYWTRRAVPKAPKSERRPIDGVTMVNLVTGKTQHWWAGSAHGLQHDTMMWAETSAAPILVMPYGVRESSGSGDPEYTASRAVDMRTWAAGSLTPTPIKMKSFNTLIPAGKDQVIRLIDRGYERLRVSDWRPIGRVNNLPHLGPYGAGSTNLIAGSSDEIILIAGNYVPNQPWSGRADAGGNFVGSVLNKSPRVFGLFGRSGPTSFVAGCMPQKQMEVNEAALCSIDARTGVTTVLWSKWNGAPVTIAADSLLRGTRPFAVPGTGIAPTTRETVVAGSVVAFVAIGFWLWLRRKRAR